MRSGVELSAAFNVVLSLVSAGLGLWFIRHLWSDVINNRDIGAVGFTMIFVTAFLFNLWDAATYAVYLSDVNNAAVLSLIQVKPFIHVFEIFAYLLLYLHFRK